MLKIEQCVGDRDAIAMSCADVCRKSSRGIAMPQAVEVVEASETVFGAQRQSKGNLLSAFLISLHAMWMRWFENEIEARYEATGGSLEIIADVLQKGFEDPKCFGFAFINAVVESHAFGKEHFVIAREQKEHLGWFLEQLTLRMGLSHPDMVASAAVSIIEWTIIRILMTGSLKELLAARLLFQCLQHA